MEVTGLPHHSLLLIIREFESSSMDIFNAYVKKAIGDKYKFVDDFNYEGY